MLMMLGSWGGSQVFFAVAAGSGNFSWGVECGSRAPWRDLENCGNQDWGC